MSSIVTDLQEKSVHLKKTRNGDKAMLKYDYLGVIRIDIWCVFS